MVSQLEGQFTPKSKDVRLLFSVMELDGTGYGVQNIEKNSTVSLSGNHNLVPRDNPQALNHFPYRCTDGSVHLLIKPPARLQIQLSK